MAGKQHEIQTNYSANLRQNGLLNLKFQGFARPKYPFKYGNNVRKA